MQSVLFFLGDDDKPQRVVPSHAGDLDEHVPQRPIPNPALDPTVEPYLKAAPNPHFEAQSIEFLPLVEGEDPKPNPEYVPGAKPFLDPEPNPEYDPDIPAMITPDGPTHREVIMRSVPDGAPSFFIDAAEVPDIPVERLDIDWDKRTVADKGPDLLALKLDAKAAVKARHATALRLLSGNYSPEERDTWTMQLEWARGYLNDGSNASLLTTMMAIDLKAQLETAGEDPAKAMAEKIIQKSRLSRNSSSRKQTA